MEKKYQNKRQSFTAQYLNTINKHVKHTHNSLAVEIMMTILRNTEKNQQKGEKCVMCVKCVLNCVCLCVVKALS